MQKICKKCRNYIKNMKKNNNKIIKMIHKRKMNDFL